MNQKLTKEIAQNLIKIQGETRGVVLKTDSEYIVKEEGKEGVKKIEDKLKELGCSIKYKEIETLNFYPIGLRILSLLVIKEIFNYNDDKIKKMGFFATKTSLIIKLFVQYFLSLERVVYKESPKMWRKHYTIGELVPIELNQEKKYGILRLKNCDLHPTFCCYLGGYFCGILQMLIKTPQINFEETKCSFRGDKYHEYLIKWQ
jgi:hypothetical protein